jgi:putative tricarboxylic transport membrane protein
LSLAACGADAAESDAEYPSEDLDWTIAFGPGGGNDIMARTMVDIIQQYELYPNNITLENREGGSGATGWGYLFNEKGSGYNVSTTSGSFITTPLQSVSLRPMTPSSSCRRTATLTLGRTGQHSPRTRAL